MALIHTETCGIPGRMLHLSFFLCLKTRAVAQSAQGHRAKRFAEALSLRSSATHQPALSICQGGLQAPSLSRSIGTGPGAFCHCGCNARHSFDLRKTAPKNWVKGKNTKMGVGKWAA